MADVRLRSVKYPTLPDRYYIKDYDEDIETISEDLEEAQTALETKAEIDGYYDEMAVGSAEQLISTVTVEDKIPYKFRTSGGSADIGNRETDKIVGGTIAWNQLIKNGDFANGTTNWSKGGGTASISAENGEATVTIRDAWNNDIRQTVPTYTNHVYLTVFSAKGNSDPMVGRGLYFATVGGSPIVSSGTVAISATYNNFAGIMKCASDSTSIRIALSADGTPYAGESFSVKNIMLIDLTQLFGSAIADYIYSLEQASAGAGVAFFRKLFPKPYYAYDTGTLKHVEGLTSHDMTGFNQWDEEWELGAYSNSDGTPTTATNSIRSKNSIKCVPNTTYYFKTTPGISGGNVYFYDANDAFIRSITDYGNHTFTTPSDCAYMRISMGTSYGTTYKHDICINLHWDGERDGEYEAYVKHSYPLDDSLVLRGIPKLDSNNQLYYDGDIYESDGTVTRKYGIVDLGTLTWAKHGSVENVFYTTGWTAQKLSASIICSKYPSGNPYNDYNAIADKTICSSISSNRVAVKDTSYSDASAFKTAMSGVYLVYELATPTTESADPCTNPQICDDFGTEEYVTESIVPVGHETYYMNNLRAKLEMAPASPDSEGDYVVRHENGENSYVPLIIPSELPDAPGSDGTYVLKVTVASGEATYSWEEET